MAKVRDIFGTIIFISLSIEMAISTPILKRHFARHPFHFKQTSNIFEHTLFNLPPFSENVNFSKRFWIKFANDNYSKYFWVEISRKVVLSLNLNKDQDQIDVTYFGNGESAIKIEHAESGSDFKWFLISIGLKEKGGVLEFLVDVNNFQSNKKIDHLPRPDELKIIFCNYMDFTDNLCHLYHI